MIETKLRFASKLCLLGFSVASLARAEQAREGGFGRAFFAASGGQRKLAAEPPSPAPPRGLRLPAFIAWQPGTQPRVGLPTPAKHAALTGGGSECATHCVERRGIERGKRLTSAVLAGVASAGLATGFVLVLTTPSASERVSVVPSFRLKFSADRAVASARWRF